MQQNSAVSIANDGSAQTGVRISAPSHDELAALSVEELNRFLALVESIDPQDWNLPTACTLWNVKDVVAHQAAHIVGFLSVKEYLKQMDLKRLRPYRQRGMNVLDAYNQAQVDLRRDRAPAEIVAEIRQHAPQAMHNHAQLSALIRAITLPLPGLDKPRSLGYLFDLIYSRDMWMHRIDIIRAIGGSPTLDAAHDGRIVALIVRDLAEHLHHRLTRYSVQIDLAGAAGGAYLIGENIVPAACIEMDALDFCILTSGRYNSAQVCDPENRLVVIEGDALLGEMFINWWRKFCIILIPHQPHSAIAVSDNRAMSEI